MDAHSLASRVTFLFGESFGIWFAVWGLRQRASWDYKLNAAARMTRWVIIGIGYALAASLPGPAAVRVIPGFVGLRFLCWPNFAYRLANFFIEWPVTEGRIISITRTESSDVIMYDFRSGGESFGGTASLKKAEIGTAECAPGQPIAIRFDPLNPRESKIA